MPIKELFMGVFSKDMEGVYKGIVGGLVKGLAERESSLKTS